MALSVNYREESEQPKLQLSAKAVGCKDAVWETISYKNEVAVALRDKKHKNVHIEFFNDRPENFKNQMILKNWYLLQFCQDCIDVKDVVRSLGE